MWSLKGVFDDLYKERQNSIVQEILNDMETFRTVVFEVSSVVGKPVFLPLF